jgi:protein-disulfide isomerase
MRRQTRTRTATGALILILGSLALSVLLLAGCQAAANKPATAPVVDAAPMAEAPTAAPAPENADAGEPIEAAEPTATPSGAAPAAESDTVSLSDTTRAGSGYQEGFTEEGKPFRGDLNAPVVIEEFSSYQCPFCARYFQETYPQIIADYAKTGKVLYIFRDYPLPSQPQSPLAAEAARCAGEVGGGSAFWAMHDTLFQRQGDWSGRGNAQEIFTGYAAELGLDTAEFEACLNSGATQVRVEADAAEGGDRGVRGTPTFFINGGPLVGAQPYTAFAQAIDAAIAGEPPPTAKPTAVFVAPTPATIAPADEEMTIGDPNAPVTVVEFSDYQCPYCAHHSLETWPLIRAEFVDSGRVRWVFKDLPLTSIHPQAFKAAEAARCAGEQEAFWEMHDRLFAGQAEWSGQATHVATFEGYAADLGLDTASFSACLESGRWAEAVNADTAEALSLGMQGTPAFFIDGYPVRGAQPFELFQYAIELAEQGTLGDAYRPQ